MVALVIGLALALAAGVLAYVNRDALFVRYDIASQWRQMQQDAPSAQIVHAGWAASDQVKGALWVDFAVGDRAVRRDRRIEPQVQPDGYDLDWTMVGLDYAESRIEEWIAKVAALDCPADAEESALLTTTPTGRVIYGLGCTYPASDPDDYLPEVYVDGLPLQMDAEGVDVLDVALIIAEATFPMTGASSSGRRDRMGAIRG